MNESNNSQNQRGLRKSLVDLNERFPDVSEMIATEKKLTFFQVLKNNLKCAFCKEKDCPARYNPEMEVMLPNWSGSYHPFTCRKK